MTETAWPEATESRPLVEHRFILRCRTTTPLHTGSGEPGVTTDAELRRSAQGKFVLPGTSIAGALRTVVERLAGVALPEGCLQYQTAFRRGDDARADRPCGCAVCNLFGDVRPRQDGSDRLRRPAAGPPARASRVTIFDAVFENPKTRVVDSVGLNRQRRAAQDSRKFDYRQILPGSELTIEVRAEQLSAQEIEWLGAALRMIACGQVGLGGRTARGNGFLHAEDRDAVIDTRELDDPQQLLNCVLSSNDADSAWGRRVAGSLSDYPGAAYTLPDRFGVSFHMAPVANGTLLIADPVRAAATGYDAAQRTLDGKPEIPGSSLAGVLRSGAERVVRTLGGMACDPTGKRCPQPKNGQIEDDSWCCLPCQLFGNEDWSSRLSVRVTTLGEPRPMPFDHVAIDRFTGGASDQKKFDALAVMEGMYKVELTIDRVSAVEHAQWIIGLLALVLRDLHQGRLWIGKGGAIGHGLVELAGRPCWEMPGAWQRLPDDLQACVDALWQKIKERQSHE